MKQTIGLLLLTILLSCGDKKSQPAPTEYEQKISRIERAEREWAEEKKTVQIYNLGYYRRGYYVELDIVGDKVVTRCQNTMDGVVTIEKGEDIGTNEWGNTPPVTLDDVYTECKKTFEKNPSARLLFSPAGDVLWCDGNFGISGLENGTSFFGTGSPQCPE